MNKHNPNLRSALAGVLFVIFTGVFLNPANAGTYPLGFGLLPGNKFDKIYQYQYPDETDSIAGLWLGFIGEYHAIYGAGIGGVCFAKRFCGAQLGMLANIIAPDDISSEESSDVPEETSGNFSFGLQVAGFANRVNTDSVFVGMQLALLHGNIFEGNERHNSEMTQKNNNRHGGTMIGIQAGGIGNTADDLWGLQLGNMNNAGIMRGLQLGFSSAAKNLAGIQMALLDNRSNVCNGFQIGAYNHAQKFNGLQLGLLNLAETGAGIQIGILNISGPKDDKRFLPLLNIVF